MEADHHQPLTVPVLPEEAQARQLFHEADTLLRSGVHIQAAHPEHRRLAQYLQHNEPALVAFYHDWHQGARLEHCQEGSDRYYYLEPPAGLWQQGSSPYAKELEREHILVAMLLCKVFFIDMRKQEFASVTELMHLLEREYEEYQEGLFRRLAQVMDKHKSELDDQQVAKLVGQSLQRFKQLGWLYQPAAGGWRVLPALARICDLYRNEINAMPDRLKARP